MEVAAPHRQPLMAGLLAAFGLLTPLLTDPPFRMMTDGDDLVVTGGGGVGGVGGVLGAADDRVTGTLSKSHTAFSLKIHSKP